jgi:hypothetical protein
VVFSRWISNASRWGQPGFGPAEQRACPGDGPSTVTCPRIGKRRRGALPRNRSVPWGRGRSAGGPGVQPGRGLPRSRRAGGARSGGSPGLRRATRVRSPARRILPLVPYKITRHLKDPCAHNATNPQLGGAQRTGDNRSDHHGADEEYRYFDAFGALMDCSPRLAS